MNISMVMADQILTLLESSGASEAEKLSALQVALAVVPVGKGSIHEKVKNAEILLGEE